MKHALIVFFFILSTTQLFLGCQLVGKDSCVPGETQACVCASGQMGAQICSGHGTSFSGCVCEGPVGDAVSGDSLGNLSKPCVNANECGDLNPCTTGLCGADGFCVFTTHTAACDDGDECTVGDRCFEGECSPGGEELPCEDGNPCTDDACVQWQGCVSTNNVLECDDGDACTLGDLCSEGACAAGSEVTTCDDVKEPECAGEIAQTFGSPGACTEDGCDYPVVEKDCEESSEVCLEGECVAPPGPELVLNGSLVVDSEEDIAEANKYMEIKGDLEITGSLPLSVQFPYLKRVGGRVWAHNSPITTELSFPKLTEVGTDFEVISVDALERLETPVLATIGGSLRLKMLPLCSQVDLQVVSAIGQDLYLEAVDGLKNIVFLELQSLTGDLEVRSMGDLKILNIQNVTFIGGSMTFEGNLEWTTFHAENLSVVGGALRMSQSPKLLQLNLPKLKNVGATADSLAEGTLAIHGLTALNTLDLQSLASVRGRLSLANTPFLSSLSFDALTHLGELHMTDIVALSSVSFPLLAAVDPCWAEGPGCPVSDSSSPGWVTVSNLSALLTFKLPLLHTLTGSLQVDQNASLQEVSLPLVASLSGLLVEENVSLTACSLPLLTLISADEGATDNALRFTDNIQCETLGLGSLEKVLGKVTINDNALPTTVDLGALTVAAALEFQRNQTVQLDLSLLADLGETPSLVITQNAHLEFVSFPPNWGGTCWGDAGGPPSGVWGAITQNPLLPQCAVQIALGCGEPGPCDGSASVPCPFSIDGNRLDCTCLGSAAADIVCPDSSKCGAADACDDANTCTEDFCTEAGTCTSLALEGACDDGDPCLTGDLCAAGACVPGEEVVGCGDDNACTDDSCEPGEGCLSVPNDDACDDGSLCTLDESCAAGSCEPGELTLACDDANDCTQDGCDPLTGCTFEPNIEVLACDDGDPCTLNDQCSGGLCAPGNTPNDCDDGNVCTQDECQSMVGCVYGPVPGDCDDGDPCTVGDVCADGACQNGPEVLDCSVPPGAHCTDDKLQEYLQVGYCVADTCLFVPTVTDCAAEGKVCVAAKCTLP